MAVLICSSVIGLSLLITTLVPQAVLYLNLFVADAVPQTRSIAHAMIVSFLNLFVLFWF